MAPIAFGYKPILLTAMLILGLAAWFTCVEAEPKEQVIHVTAKKFAFIPDTITLKQNVPVILEFTTEDVLMGFYVPELGLRADIVPGIATRVRIVPDRLGEFTFICDVFCGTGHEDMTGMIIVVKR